MWFGWRGAAPGAYEDGGRVTVATTSSGDRKIDPSDSFVTVMQNARGVADPLQGPSGHGPSAHVLGTRAGVLTSVGDMYADPFSDSYPGFDPAHIGYVFTLRLEPGQTVALVTFVVKGLSEVYDPRGGFPIAIKDGLLREYLTRLTLYDRHGPSFRALLALSPRAFADARPVMPTGGRDTCGARSTASPSSSRTTSTRRSCPRRAAPEPWSTIGRASIRVSPRA